MPEPVHFCCATPVQLSRGSFVTLGPALHGFLTKPEFLDQTGRWQFMWERQRDAVIRGAVEMVLGGLLLVARDALIERLHLSSPAGVR
jgi:hypothetical protein